MADRVSPALLAARAGGRGGLGRRALLHGEQLRVRPAPGDDDDYDGDTDDDDNDVMADRLPRSCLHLDTLPHPLRPDAGSGGRLQVSVTCPLLHLTDLLHQK